MAGDPECCVAGVLKVALGKSGELPRLVSFMPLPNGTSIDEGFLDPANRMLYLGVDAAGEGCKLLKLRLGEGDAPPRILASTPLYVK